MKTYTVLGYWFEGNAFAVGAILGEHQVDGDTLDYTDMGPFATTVQARSAQEACALAVDELEAENDEYNEGYGPEPEIVTE